MEYQHRWQDGHALELPLGKIVCVGRNYAAHARELNNPIPDEPLLFIKPASSAVPLQVPLRLPQGRGPVHFETELAFLIGAPLCNATETQVKAALLGVGLALDLTLRELQAQLKKKGHPWERAKGFDGACPLSPWIACCEDLTLDTLGFSLHINGALRQRGNSGQMLWPVLPLVAHISRQFSLAPGDVVLTGTPAGVGALAQGERLELALLERYRFGTVVA